LAGHDGVVAALYENPALARAYHAGNEMPQISLKAWTELVGHYVPAGAADVLDLGAGTGMFTVAMARWLPVERVTGIDPSIAMVAQARRRSTGTPVQYVAGTAEAIPTRDDVFDLVLLSRVVHHLPDRRRCAAELVRVLRNRGSVVVRTTFSGHLDGLVYDYWPTLLAYDQRRFPRRDELLADFASAGLSAREMTSFAQPVTSSLAEYHRRMTSRPQSKFVNLTDEEFRSGLARLAADVEVERATEPGPVSERYDVAVFQAR
jgi:2-polyprenyl-3-methyl-5-hydroxy-6-metoxy-1,4-benzoquinol methylase